MTTPWRPPRTDTPPTVVITVRQAQVLSLICLGMSNAEIGRRLYLSLDTVKTFCKRLFRALGARNRAHAAALACSRQVLIVVTDNPWRRAA